MLDHWPVGQLLLMLRRPVFPKRLADLTARLLGELGAAQLDLERLVPVARYRPRQYLTNKN